MAGLRVEVECGPGQRLSELSFRVPIWTERQLPARGGPRCLPCTPSPRGTEPRPAPSSHVTFQLTFQLTRRQPAVGHLPRAPGKGRGWLRALSPRRRDRNEGVNMRPRPAEGVATAGKGIEVASQGARDRRRPPHPPRSPSIRASRGGREQCSRPREQRMPRPGDGNKSVELRSSEDEHVTGMRAMGPSRGGRGPWGS